MITNWRSMNYDICNGCFRVVLLYLKTKVKVIRKKQLNKSHVTSNEWVTNTLLFSWLSSWKSWRNCFNAKSVHRSFNWSSFSASLCSVRSVRAAYGWLFVKKKQSAPVRLYSELLSLCHSNDLRPLNTYNRYFSLVFSSCSTSILFPMPLLPSVVADVCFSQNQTANKCCKGSDEIKPFWNLSWA